MQPEMQMRKTSLPGPTEEHHCCSRVFYQECGCHNRFALTSWKWSDKFGMSDRDTAHCKHPSYSTDSGIGKGSIWKLHTWGSLSQRWLWSWFLLYSLLASSCSTCQRAEKTEEVGPKAKTTCACWLHDEKPSFLPRLLTRRSQRSCCQSLQMALKISADLYPPPS